MRGSILTIIERLVLTKVLIPWEKYHTYHLRCLPHILPIYHQTNFSKSIIQPSTSNLPTNEGPYNPMIEPTRFDPRTCIVNLQPIHQ